jgi:5'-nucleotidase
MPIGLRLLLTNDDGIDAPGIEALEQAVAGLGEIFVVAPDGPRSGCGHQVTNHAPIAINAVGDRRWAIGGTPADCVRLAFDSLCGPVDWVLSGINAGGNLGVDVFRSGTVAAVREAAINGVNGIAISHYLARGMPFNWTRAGRWARRMIEEILARDAAPNTYWNVNLPHPGPEVVEVETVECAVDPSPMAAAFDYAGGAATYRGVYAERRRRPGMDVDVCLGGAIAVSRLGVMQ